MCTLQYWQSLYRAWRYVYIAVLTINVSCMTLCIHCSTDNQCIVHDVMCTLQYWQSMYRAWRYVYIAVLTINVSCMTLCIHCSTDNQCIVHDVMCTLQYWQSMYRAWRYVYIAVLPGAEERGVRRCSMASFLISNSSLFAFLSAIKPACMNAVHCATSVWTSKLAETKQPGKFLNNLGNSSLANLQYTCSTLMKGLSNNNCIQGWGCIVQSGYVISNTVQYSTTRKHAGSCAGDYALMWPLAI